MALEAKIGVFVKRSLLLFVTIFFVFLILPVLVKVGTTDKSVIIGQIFQRHVRNPI